MDTDKPDAAGTSTTRTALGPRAQRLDTASVPEGSWGVFRVGRAASRGRLFALFLQAFRTSALALCSLL